MNSVSTAINHFIASNRADIMTGKEVLQAGNASKFDELLERIQRKRSFQVIANLVATSRKHMEAFARDCEKIGSWGKTIAGIVLIAGGILGAAALGKLLAVAVVLLGILTFYEGLGDLKLDFLSRIIG